MGVIAIPRVLREKFGDEPVEALVDVINKVKSSWDSVTKADLAEEAGTLRVEIANVKADIIKWMFLFWIGQTAEIVALFKFFIK
ncbi:MAG: hypothetical protein HQK97_08470 [Nitrospirae bacterium]|nr:hypothetical protein [Nitrospirota bacterium]